MDRANSKHGRHLDEQMSREVRNYLQGPPAGGRSSDWRDAEPRGGEDEPDVSPIPRPDPMPLAGNSSRLSNAVREQRSRLGVFLPRSIFPARRAHLLTAAAAADAPDDLLAELARLPADHTFATVAEIWPWLGYTVDERF